jgi:hypothetical protein
MAGSMTTNLAPFVWSLGILRDDGELGQRLLPQHIMPELQNLFSYISPGSLRVALYDALDHRVIGVV